MPTGSSLESPDPVIVVEVPSPTSGARDKVRKRADHFSLPSVAHHLVVDPQTRLVLHFDRASDGGEGRLLHEGDTVELAPTGLAPPDRRCFGR